MENQYAHTSPRELRKLIAQQEITGTTAGMALGYAQANLLILPEEFAIDFEKFCHRNYRACPLLEVVRGKKLTSKIAKEGNIYTDIPRYCIYKDGEKVDEVLDINDYYQDNLVGFLLGCSFSFEEELIKQGINLRHVEQGINVAMFKTNVPCHQVGIFKGNMVASMRPIPLEQVDKAFEITARFPKVHGAPVALTAQDLGIEDLTKPDFGDAVEIKPNEVPMFWACGVTPQNIVLNSNIPLAISHAPGCMFIADIKNSQLEF